MTDPDQQKPSWKGPLSLSASYTLVMTPVNIAPFLTMAIMAGLSISEDQTGLILTLELVMVALTSSTLAQLGPRLPLRGVLLAGAGLVLLGNILSVQAGSMDFLIICRVIAGIGAGLLLLGVNIGIAASTDPVRHFGFANTAGLVAAVILSLILPGLVGAYKLAGGYGTLSVLVLICLPMIFLSPLTKQRGTTETRLPPMPVRKTGVLALILALLITPATYLSFYVFSAPIGTRIGMSTQFIGVLLAMSQLTGVVASSFASWLGSRFGILGPLAIALSAQAVAILIATQTESSMVFVICFILLNTLFLFSMPFQLGIGAALDKSGRLAAIGAGAFYFGAAGGPFLGGYLITYFGVTSIGFVVIAGVVCALACFWFVVPPNRIGIQDDFISSR